MSNLRKIIAQTKNINKKIFIPFVMCGYPNLHTTMELVKALEKLGIQVIELGIPFSDPIADGVINQTVAHKAVQAKVSVRDCLKLIASLRAMNCKMQFILYSYSNPIYQYGVTRFLSDAADVGANGILLVDLPPEQLISYFDNMKNLDISPILLMSPNSPMSRLAIINDLQPAFIYYVMHNSVTGPKDQLPDRLQQQLYNLRQQTQLPIAAGVGIKTTTQVTQLKNMDVDAVICGSALMQQLMQEDGMKKCLLAAKNFIEALGR